MVDYVPDQTKKNPADGNIQPRRILPNKPTQNCHGKQAEAIHAKEAAKRSKTGKD